MGGMAGRVGKFIEPPGMGGKVGSAGKFGEPPGMGGRVGKFPGVNPGLNYIYFICYKYSICIEAIFTG